MSSKSGHPPGICLRRTVIIVSPVIRHFQFFVYFAFAPARLIDNTPRRQDHNTGQSDPGKSIAGEPMKLIWFEKLVIFFAQVYRVLIATAFDALVFAPGCFS